MGHEGRTPMSPKKDCWVEVHLPNTDIFFKVHLGVAFIISNFFYTERQIQKLKHKSINLDYLLRS